jgi:hypothetical protein
MTSTTTPEPLHFARYLDLLARMLETSHKDAENLRALVRTTERTDLTDTMDDAVALLSWRCDMAARLCRSPWHCPEAEEMVKRFEFTEPVNTTADKI